MKHNLGGAQIFEHTAQQKKSTGCSLCSADGRRVRTDPQDACQSLKSVLAGDAFV